MMISADKEASGVYKPRYSPEISRKRERALYGFVPPKSALLWNQFDVDQAAADMLSVMGSTITELKAVNNREVSADFSYNV